MTEPDDAWAPVQGGRPAHPSAGPGSEFSGSPVSGPRTSASPIAASPAPGSPTTAAPAPLSPRSDPQPAGSSRTPTLPFASAPGHTPVASSASPVHRADSTGAPVAAPPGTAPPAPGVLHAYPGGPPSGPATPPVGLPLDARRRGRGVPGTVVALLVLVSLLAGVVAGLFASRWLPADPGPRVTGLPTDTTTTAVDQADPVGDTWISEVAAASLPSTVHIEVRVGDGGVSGSGFVVREDGYVVTNHHVIAPAEDGAGEVTVVFSDGTEAAAEIVGGTPDYDLAVLRIERTGLQPLLLGDSDALAVGDPVLAVGSPLGLTGSVTSGIVSAVERPVTVRDPQAGEDDPSSYINAVQTDAAINRGNSGGPLIDAVGQVVGVNTAVARDAASAGGGNEPGFAIPSNQVRHTVEQIIATGEATYPVIGVVLDPEHQGEGVRVRTDEIDGVPPVTPGGPADQAGVTPGDVIVAVDGDPVSQPTELIVRVRSHLPGETLVLTVRTTDGDRDLDVVLGEAVSR